VITDREATTYEFLGRFLGLAVSAAEMPNALPAVLVRESLLQIAAEYQQRIDKLSFPGALIETEGQTVRGHQEGHEAGK
jgi:hypothetical protein